MSRRKSYAEGKHSIPEPGSGLHAGAETGAIRPKVMLVLTASVMTILAVLVPMGFLAVSGEAVAASVKPAPMAPPSVSSISTGVWDVGDDSMYDGQYQQRILDGRLSTLASKANDEYRRLESGDYGDDHYHDSGFMMTADDAAGVREDSRFLTPQGFDGNHGTGDSGNAYEFSQCTWWAYVRRHELGLPAGSRMGNGADWADTASSLGYWVDSTPRPGDVMVFPRGVAGSDSSYGHVAVVENVIVYDGATYVVTSESGSVFNGRAVSRIIDDVGRFRYIHY